MATKTITLELDAYEKLRRAKRPGESFTAVVRRVDIPTPAITGKELLAYLEKHGACLTEEQLDELDQNQLLDAPPVDRWTES
jgi:predicted CopG family antitoxin